MMARNGQGEAAALGRAADSGMRRALVFLVIFAHVAACGGPSRQTYNSSEVGQIVNVEQGRIVSSRPIDIQKKGSGVGTVAGGGAGGIGMLIAVPGLGLAAFLLGALAGAVVGTLVEDEMNHSNGTEYVVEMDDGRVVVIAQSGDDIEPLEAGTEVLVQYGGNYTRLLERPSSMERGSGGGSWVNPDLQPPIGGEGPRPAAPPPAEVETSPAN